MAGSDTNEEDADVNHDGTVDVADIASVIDIMANKTRLLLAALRSQIEKVESLLSAQTAKK